MKRMSILAFALVCLLVSCESTGYAPPPVTEKMAKIDTNRASLARLRQGRTLFVSRCIECHTLPAVTHHRAAEWPAIVDEMAGRASLKRAERDAIVAYILAARAHQ
jgi:mono/diheme cytochrome c family protein